MCYHAVHFLMSTVAQYWEKTVFPSYGDGSKCLSCTMCATLITATSRAHQHVMTKLPQPCKALESCPCRAVLSTCFPASSRQLWAVPTRHQFIQELHQGIWECLCHVAMASLMPDWPAWYQRLVLQGLCQIHSSRHAASVQAEAVAKQPLMAMYDQ